MSTSAPGPDAPGDRNAPPGSEPAEPDPRFTFANERTFLAWSRTALALIAGGLAVSQLSDRNAQGLMLAAAVALIAFGAFISLVGYRQWRRNQQALRLGQPVPPSTLPGLLAYGIALVALAAAALAVVRLAS